jgi:flagella basal body P-ring formation protein FlgA
VLAHQTIDAQAEVRQIVAIARTPIRRGETITAADVAFEPQWIASTQRPAAPSIVIGSAAKAQMQAGQVMLDRDIHAPVVVSRGDIVSVHVVSGSLVVESRARALASARDGEIVEFESLDPNARQRSKFKARMNGRGRAVMLAETISGPSASTAPSEHTNP